MAEIQKAIFTNMCMITDGMGNVLVLERIGTGWDGIVFPGGHVEEGESFYASVVREVYEETGLTIDHPQLCGIKQGMTKNGARYVVLLYRADRYTGDLRSSEEGRVFWMPRRELDHCPQPRSFREMVMVMESEQPKELYCPEAFGQWEIL